MWSLLGVFQCFLKNVRLLLKDINERLLLKENVQLIFFVCVAASRNISMFFSKRAVASDKILTTAKKKMWVCFLKLLNILKQKTD